MGLTLFCSLGCRIVFSHGGTEPQRGLSKDSFSLCLRASVKVSFLFGNQIGTTEMIHPGD